MYKQDLALNDYQGWYAIKQKKKKMSRVTTNIADDD